jgi:hypothetical protein
MTLFWVLGGDAASEWLGGRGSPESMTPNAIIPPGHGQRATKGHEGWERFVSRVVA